MKIKCTCSCHEPGSQAEHCLPCCDNGWIDVPDIPDSELKRIEADATTFSHSFKESADLNENIESAYIGAAKAEYLRAQEEIAELKKELAMSQESFTLLAAKGPRWVKASERTPDPKKEVHFTYNFPGYDAAKYVGYLQLGGEWFISGGLAFHRDKFQYIEWLEEFPTGEDQKNKYEGSEYDFPYQEEKRKAIKCMQCGSPNQFLNNGNSPKRCWYCKERLNEKDIVEFTIGRNPNVQEDQGAAEREKQMAFFIWAYKEGYYVPNSNYPRTWCNGPKNDWPQMCYTDEELYDLFLQENKL